MCSADRDDVLTKNLLRRHGWRTIEVVRHLVDVAQRFGYRGAYVTWAMEHMQVAAHFQDPETYSDDELVQLLKSAAFHLSPHEDLNDDGDLVIMPDALTDRSDPMRSDYEYCDGGVVCYPVYRDDGTQSSEEACEY